MAWDGRFDTSHYNTQDLIDDLRNCISHGIVSAKALPDGGVEVMENRGDGTARLNVYYPKGDGKYAHLWVDSNGKTYTRK